MKSVVYCKFHLEGLHHWPNCPIEEVSYLRDIHRHNFHFKVIFPVTHSDRDVEFIFAMHQVRDYLLNKYFDPHFKCCHFESMSCEMLAQEVIDQFGAVEVDVSEDGECGAVVYKETTNV